MLSSVNQVTQTLVGAFWFSLELKRYYDTSHAEELS